MSAKVQVVSTAPTILSDVPHWDEKRQVLYYVDIIVGDIHRFDPNTKAEDKVHADKSATFVIPRSDNPDEFAFGNERSVNILNWSTGKVRSVGAVDGDKPADITRINEGKCDAAGRLWTGTVHNTTDFANIKPNLGSVYSIDAKHVVVKRYSPMTVPNGLAWSNDNKHMFFVDSAPATVSVFDYNLASAYTGNRKVAVDFKALGAKYGQPDGITVDRNGHLWIACFRGSGLVQADPETGKVLQTVQLPVNQLSSCCFGGPNLNDLYVTSIKVMLSEEELKAQPQAGRVFKVTGLNVAGSNSNTFAG